MQKETPVQIQLALAITNASLHLPELEPMIEIYHKARELTELEIKATAGAIIDQVRCARLKKDIKAFVDKLNEANGRSQ